MSFPRPLPHMMKPKSILADIVVEDTDGRPMWEILVPTVSNSGRPFTVRHHRALLRRLSPTENHEEA